MVGISITGSSNNRQIRIDIDREGPAGVQITDCQNFSRTLGDELDEIDLFANKFVLEVSSPGLDRPIVSEDDVRRNTGRRVQISTKESIAGSREFRGVLLGMHQNVLRLRDDQNNEIEIPIEIVKLATQDISF